MSKPGKVLKGLCKKLGVRLTVKRGKKRVYKSVAVLKRQCANKKKKVKRKVKKKVKRKVKKKVKRKRKVKRRRKFGSTVTSTYVTIENPEEDFPIEEDFPTEVEDRVPSLKTLAAKTVAENIDLKDLKDWEKMGVEGKQVLHQASLRLSTIKEGPDIGSVVRLKGHNIVCRVTDKKVISEEYEENSYVIRASWTSTRYVPIFTLKSIDSSDKFEGVRRKHFVWILNGINLRGADLQKVEFKDIDFEGANFEGADLRGADIRDCNFKGANLRGADLRTFRPSHRYYSKKTRLLNNQFALADLRGAKYDSLKNFHPELPYKLLEMKNCKIQNEPKKK